MNFKPYLLEKVLDGTKTQTRRLCKPGEYGQLEDRTAVWIQRDTDHRMKWYTGQILAAAPGRGKKGVGHIRITDIDITTPEDISEEDAIAEGFGSAAEFLEAWDTINGKDKRAALVWVLTFELAKP